RAVPMNRSEFLMEKGMVDLVVDRREMKAIVANALRFMGTARPAAAAAMAGVEPAVPIVVTEPASQA
ncbi:MAG: hypothetical protein DMG03_25900, partial [Acidobacteria bacterium]